MGMSKRNREIIRAVYQSIPTEDEKAAFEKILGATTAQKVEFILANQNVLKLTEEQRNAILAATALTKEDRIILGGSLIRLAIFRVLSFLGLQ